MQQDILDDAARAFTRGFYQALGNGESINFAFEWGCDRIQLEINRSTAIRQGKVVGVTETLKVPEHFIPILLKKPNPVTISSSEPVEELNNSDLEKIVDLLIRSGRAEYSARKALCIKIGIEPHQLGFLRQSTDADFALELINYLHTIDNQQALCKLCNQLETVFKTGRYASDLNNIKSKLNFK
nr:hypothetical protein [Mastigocoleus sp. MO_167.B18]